MKQVWVSFVDLLRESIAEDSRTGVGFGALRVAGGSGDRRPAYLVRPHRKSCPEELCVLAPWLGHADCEFSHLLAALEAVGAKNTPGGASVA